MNVNVCLGRLRREAINGNQRPSTTIRDHQRQSETINGNQRPSTAIGDHQRQSEVINAEGRADAYLCFEYLRGV